MQIKGGICALITMSAPVAPPFDKTLGAIAYEVALALPMICIDSHRFRNLQVFQERKTPVAFCILIQYIFVHVASFLNGTLLYPSDAFFMDTRA